MSRKVTRLVYIVDYFTSQKMDIFDFDLQYIPKDFDDPWIKKRLGEFDQVVLAAFDGSRDDELIIIWDKYTGWQNGFEHFNDDRSDEC